MTIWKFPVRHSGVPEVFDVPRHARWLSVQYQGDTLVAWAEVNPDTPRVRRQFLVYSTGWDDCPHSNAEHYIGTAQMPPFVWHVYIAPVKETTE
jgi:hypothetical protein